ncbi:MAG: ankyrin repeat domain-containing protein, partial [Myxococcales bacterium]|nr:ankyrin repeat domain-containing protein [Myxococcales bacterium]
EGAADVVGLLLDAGADANAASLPASGGGTALHEAARRGDAGGVEIARALLAHGADPARADASGARAIDVARAVGSERLVRLLAERS